MDETNGPGVESAGDIGQVIVMKTDGGPHSAEDWGRVTTDKIMELIVVEPTATPESLNDYHKFQASLLDAMTEKHGFVQRRERSLLADQGVSHLADPIDPADLANQALAEIVGLTSGTVLSSHFMRQEVQNEIYRTVGQHFSDNIHIERSWFAEGLPDDESARAYLNKLSLVSMPSAATVSLMNVSIF